MQTPEDIARSTLHAMASAPAETKSAPEQSRTDLGRRQAWQAQQRQLLQDPRYVEALRGQHRLSYRLRRDNAVRLFGFSRETANTIVELDIDAEIRMMTFDPGDTGESLRGQYEAVQRDHDAKMLALLGQDRFDRWQTYMETRGTRMQVDQFRSQLAGSDPLREDQVEPLITAMAAEQKQMRTELDEFRNTLDWNGDSAEPAGKYRERQIEITKATNKRILDSVASILSTAQVDRLAEMLESDLQQRAMQNRMESLRNRIGPAPEADAGAD